MAVQTGPDPRDLEFTPAIGDDPTRLFATLRVLESTMVIDAIEVQRVNGLQLAVDPEAAEDLDLYTGASTCDGGFSTTTVPGYDHREYVLFMYPISF